jgi:hypothetical protein
MKRSAPDGNENRTEKLFFLDYKESQQEAL